MESVLPCKKVRVLLSILGCMYFPFVICHATPFWPAVILISHQIAFVYNLFVFPAVNFLLLREENNI